ncbi:MAG: phosphate acyltransferase PlsX [Wenzhouxiangella sp.]
MSQAQAVRVAVDLMGGDGGADLALEALPIALSADPALHCLCVGSRSTLARIPSLPSSLRQRIDTLPGEQTLPADVSAAQAIRQGQDSSLAVAMKALANDQADALVSAGSTVGLMALSRQLLGMLPGIERPALMTSLPTLAAPVWVLDLGANVQVDARRLLEFAQLGSVAVEIVTGRTPRIGLLNIGSEPGKGPDMLREAARLIDAEATLDYAGFVEGDQVFCGQVDLVVCDGFAGNVLLKSAEGAVRLTLGTLREALRGSLAAGLLRGRLRRVHDSLDPARHNGAPMLGVRGTVIKSHGSASGPGLAHAIDLAARQARGGLVRQLENRLWSAE